MEILNGKEVAQYIKDNVKKEVEHLKALGKRVTLTVIQVGDNSASSVYVKNKENACAYCGIESEVLKLPEEITEEELIELIESLNEDEGVDGILVQLPLPVHIREKEVLYTIDPAKDVDGFHPVNVGKHMIGEDTFVPCTAAGIIKILDYYDIPIEGKSCVVVGRSNIVGKPVATELLKRNGTVTICHSKTMDLEFYCNNADIVICAIGQPKFFRENYFMNDVTVIDVGIHRLEDGTICGDVDFESVRDKEILVTPVPGGVGAMTVAMLMENCVKAAKGRN